MFVFSLMFCLAVIMGSTTILSQDTLPVRWDYSDLYVSYPAEARDHQLEGTVVVWVRVDERGNVKSWRIVNSMSDPLDSAVISGIRSLRFKPRAINGRAVANGEAYVRFSFGGHYGGHGLDQYEHAVVNYNALLDMPEHTIGVLYYTERFYGRGRVRFIHGDIERARTDYDIARKRGCELPWYGKVQHDLVDPLLPRDTTSRDSLMKYAQLLSEYQLPLEALDMLLRIMAKYGEQQDVILELAKCYGVVQDWQKKWDMYRWCIQHGDTTTSVRLAASWAAYLARDDRSAVELCEELADKYPDDQNIQGNYGLALLTLERYAEATAIYQRIEDMEGDPSYYMLSDLKRHIGIGFPGKDKAREILRDVFKIPVLYIP